MGLMKELADLNSLYKSMYTEGKAESPEAEEEKDREDDDLFGSPNPKKKKNKVKKEEFVLEKDLSAKERRALPDSDFALPGKGKGPQGSNGC